MALFFKFSCEQDGDTSPSCQDIITNKYLFMDKQTNEKSTMQTQETGAGRTSETGDNKANKENARQDISSIDRQEGEMDNGETGGNFREGDQGKEKQ
jgi:hypothetical protein